MLLSQDQLQAIITEAEQAAKAAAANYFATMLGGQDGGACGFAWVNIYGIKGNTKMGKLLKQAGITQDYSRAFQVWNPSKFPCQNVDTLEAGARAYAKVFEKHGFEAYPGSRLD